jgi:hypothetical protein
MRTKLRKDSTITSLTQPYMYKFIEDIMYLKLIQHIKKQNNTIDSFVSSIYADVKGMGRSFLSKRELRKKLLSNK